MIDSKTRQKLIQELEKSGNVYLSCLKVGINRSTFYRWRDGDPKFRKLAGKAMRIGWENNCDIAEHALMINVKEKRMEAIKYVLSRQSSRYRPKDKKVTLIHSNTNTSEKAIAAKKKDDIRVYSAGYSDAMKVFLEGKREEFKRYDTEEATLERVEEVRSGKANDLDEDLMEEGRRQYAKENGEPIEEEVNVVEESPPPKEPSNLDEEAVNKIVLDLPDDDDN